MTDKDRQYLRDVGTDEFPCWVPCAKGDSGAVLFTRVSEPIWRDIEIAPRDGTPILLYCPYSHAQVWQGSFTEGQWWIDMLDEAQEPTHWMPLPPPPTDTGRE